MLHPVTRDFRYNNNTKGNIRAKIGNRNTLKKKEREGSVNKHRRFEMGDINPSMKLL